MPARSQSRPHSPSSASTSRIRGTLQAHGPPAVRQETAGRSVTLSGSQKPGNQPISVRVRLQAEQRPAALAQFETKSNLGKLDFSLNPLQAEWLGAGSYYEHVKISEPNEFDIMLLMRVERLQLDECDDTGAFYYLSFKRNPKEKYLLKFLDEDGKLSAFKMLQALREIIKQEVKTIKDAEVTVKRKKAGSPAITLQIRNPPTDISVDIILTLKVQQNWPPSTQDGLRVEQWLGRKVRGDLRSESLYLVAKQNKKEKVPRGNTWRLSFSHVEKAMLNNHGSSKTCCEANGPKCCRKGCLKLLKYLLEQLKMKYTKELDKFCSYHVKTAYFHSCVMWPHDTDWHWGDLEHCFHKYLGYFLDCLQRSQLPHFFIPQYNLLSPEDKASNNFLSRQLNYQLNNNFPIFQERN
ncbi:PREDICTED: cyclic GMP-AMP synthase [Calidris pugnax]|uniref:cyclic GMP-AMP synthase n=1 Tax=Calidris pugnax TaxID=198806 RepID=UPI00071E0523|nr:PREDICTED: cyclic GMP-AMP synthase [Calidris pugnax]